MKLVRRPLALVIPAVAAVLLAGAAVLYAQLEGAERGIPPVDSTSNFEVMSVDVDVAADTGETCPDRGMAAGAGDRVAHAVGADTQSPLVRSAQSFGIGAELDRVGHRHRQRADRAEPVYRAARRPLRSRPHQPDARRHRRDPAFGAIAGDPGDDHRIGRLQLRVPQRLAARLGAIPHRQQRDRLCPADRNRASTRLVLNYAQTMRRGRGWWRMLLDQYGAADIVVPELDLRRLYPGGPAIGIFTARYGPDNLFIGRFQLTARNSSEIPAMLAEGVRRLDILYAQALQQGLLRPDPTLVIIQPPLPPPPPTETAVVPEETGAPPPTSAATSYSLQVSTPDAGAVQQAEVSVSRASGVTSAITTSLALGGTSLMRVTFVGDTAALQAALAAQGWQVQVVNGTTLRISR